MTNINNDSTALISELDHSSMDAMVQFSFMEKQMADILSFISLDKISPIFLLMLWCYKIL